jgi:hypothetical protein
LLCGRKRLGDNSIANSNNLVTDAIDGLCLCPCDINTGNFKKHTDGKVVALNFRATCFLPASFFAVAMKIKVAQRVDYCIRNRTMSRRWCPLLIIWFPTEETTSVSLTVFYLPRLTLRLNRSSQRPPPEQGTLTRCHLLYLRSPSIFLWLTFSATVILDQPSLLLYTYYRLILHLPIVIIVAREKLAQISSPIVLF